MKVNIIKEIRRVVKVQAESLRLVNGQIGKPFEHAVQAMFRCKGKIILTGIGKSGLVAQKMASTLSSTGTPAIYLHPAEGMHGNLGIVNSKDVVVAVGKSGESEEILNLIPSIRKIGAKIIALTANDKSSLAKQSSIVLHTPILREVCPLNLAPTTSTTIAMVIGDAIAIALMQMRGFGAEDFALYHPGGLLGKKLLLRISDVMRSGKNNPVVYIGSSLNKLLLEITDKWTGACSVVDKKKKFLGLVTDYDLRKLLKDPKRLASATIKDVMNAKATYVFADDMAVKALGLMEGRSKPFTVLPVVDRKRRAVGMIHVHDLITRGLMQIGEK